MASGVEEEWESVVEAGTCAVGSRDGDDAGAVIKMAVVEDV